jgi:2-(1,2-epoxy-1,2-dihydrophenyl)acetyl-CoA isomerase
MPDLILLAEAEGVATLVLNRPERLNAFADDMREQLIAALDAAAARGGIGALVLTGAGRAFSAGGDVHHMAALRQRGAGAEALRPLIDAGRAAIEKLVALPFPTIAAVNGPAAGAGLNLALACDLRIASERASFAESFVRIGLHPDWGGTFFLPRRVGLARALELAWTGDSIDAAEALRIGLVNQVVPHEAARALARRLAAAPRLATRLIKRSLHAALERPLAACLDAETEAQAACWASADVAEGLAAFTEKRQPAFGEGGPARESMTPGFARAGSARRRFE